jgi:hypothetical protein
MTYPLSAYPLRCLECAFCQATLHKDGPDQPWKDPFGGDQCEHAPNPDDGPMPGHEPGSPVVARPPEPERVFVENPPPPHIVRIPPDVK